MKIEPLVLGISIRTSAILILACDPVVFARPIDPPYTPDIETAAAASAASVTVNGKLMCVDQDMHSCPIKGHGITPVTGTAGFKSSGKNAVKTGDTAGCGAVIITGSEDTSTD